MKNKAMKKIAALVAAMAMTVSLVACGDVKETSSSESKVQSDSGTVAESETKSDKVSEEKKEDITIRVFLQDTAGTDVQMVSEAVNEYVQDKLGFGVELVQYGAGEYASKMPLALLSDEQVDLVYRNGDEYVTAMKDGSLMDISALLPEVAPKLWELVPESYWAAATIDGKIGGVPVIKEAGNNWGFYLSKSFVEEKNINLEGIDTLEELDGILAALIADGRAGLMYASKGWHVSSGFPGYETVTGSYLVPHAEGNDTIVCQYLTEEYEDFCNLMRDWYNKGYIRKDAATNQEEDESDEKSGLRGVNYSPGGEGTNKVYIPMTDAYIGSNVGRRGLNVAAKSEYPEECLKFLELYYTDPELAVLMHYGIEGRHYNMVGERIELVENYNSMHFHQTSKAGNMLQLPLLTTDIEGKWDLYREFNANCKVSKLMGFAVDLGVVEAEAAAVNAVIAEFSTLLNIGAVDPAKKLPEFKKALIDAGVEKVIAEIQSQYNAFMAAK